MINELLFKEAVVIYSIGFSSQELEETARKKIQ